MQWAIRSHMLAQERQRLEDLHGASKYGYGGPSSRAVTAAAAAAGGASHAETVSTSVDNLARTFSRLVKEMVDVCVAQQSTTRATMLTEHLMSQV